MKPRNKTVSLRSKRFRASSSRKLEREQKKEWRGRGRGVKEPSGSSPFHFFCSRSKFRAITRLLRRLTPLWRSLSMTASLTPANMHEIGGKIITGNWAGTLCGSSCGGGDSWAVKSPGVGTKKQGKCPVLLQLCNIVHWSHSRGVPF